ncbi:MAG TPA: uroporphyrinogen-III C-methyltransferase [Ottowia sp.]|jgi:uroporphyrin-III C-methyltransferase|nr:MAG: uroporphyrinogen-III C-methyltransferase [Burkholderiales bacterium 68-10]HMT63521.1 uroporphyrinogen-III C-methyltransferase [Ottowia sp.]HMT81877.1 uroporphyrinogen-III C-methyltransferase [Ottowia sp.]HOK12206.1 uroporphyrinogen-III C-methyltransferase [Ottowia sp.]HON29859.1 uroporphyrinogen-III C-methyltransferase [Ottowia sp.]
MSSSSPGHVTLVGAGPGDPELLTLKAVRAIQAASVILVDDLVGDGVLAHARPDARITYVGKRGGCQSTPQATIEQLMLQAALAGENVVRLKGGDPFIFGRGGEEVDSLRRAGIEPVIVNGITAGLAALSSLGAPLTHRDYAQGVVFVTGHPQKDGPGVDWARLAESARELRLTLVIYMGISSAARIQAGLLTALPADTPVAVIERASLPAQRQCVTRLGDLLADLRQCGLGSPAVVVVGDVVRGVAAAHQHQPLLSTA